MDSFPIFLTLTGVRVLVVGGGAAAAAKARLALKAGARVSVFAPALSADWQDLRGHPALDHRQGFPGQGGEEEWRDVRLVYAAGESLEEDRAVHAAASARGVLVNVVDRPELCDFLTPAIVDRSPIVVAIGTGGRAPVLARRVRAAIDRLLPARLGALARLAEGFRGTVAQALPDGDRRRRFWDRFFDGAPALAALEGDEPRARTAALRLLNDGEALDNGAPAAGVVHLVGAGPGDPDLLTLKAQRLLQEADALVYDDLVGEGILDMARRDAARIYVGKRKGRASLTQEQIGRLMCDLAAAGRVVVRLKGGDPAVFARLSEEIDALAAAGVAWTVVPGITAASAAAAAIGISLTDRDGAPSVTLLSGHRRAPAAGESEAAVDWRAAARTGGTLAVYMGLSRATAAAEGLIEGGLSAETPVAVVHDASRQGQRVSRGTLGELPRLVAQGALAAPDAPGLVLVGKVVAKAGRLPAIAPVFSTPRAFAGDPSFASQALPSQAG
ncbi:siroheme synthase CysG [Rhodospirillum rubrum]|uniref:Uroporphyrinogen-III C-methyltransferase n=1 Tax=Rhodospirillum rubrum (strain ATCC 11170 / ATH 1.1.1 / DSM 467 / LMG 4362 / NCIMB 8255 / S1) TaxID=269796 RepID=Q2RT12_RHORT|nr:siroheme synthase CysG [Rhodospirillum rubrum]ABC22733.1 uroporphyrinogen-III C-methyltransferase [Rhodospirillum rubrum ATCC 11170]AEO48453.1 uroporphyrinogen-III C-methyltransferase [Rhodospirillum rubrum F11]MBK5954331.1 uroporphyrinogen-III C-methyltransferase [Rhodospirillum rubrum]QXG78725.1 siroheme synthase CysG [Rhodospirillum rubrum]HAQ00529.1 uroporphyrinogen-III C-methyltransferase [Rhodospirillum rubrum]